MERATASSFRRRGIQQQEQTLTPSAPSDRRSTGVRTQGYGKWRLAKNPDRFTPIDPTNPLEQPDWAFGNPLTYHDPISNELGRKRQGSENVHSMLAERFRLLRGKQNFRNKTQAELEATMIFCAMHAASMEYRRLAAPPGEADMPLAV